MRRALTQPLTWTDGRIILVLFAVGVIVSFVVPGNLYRGWFALAAFLFSLTFVLVYSRRNWRSTFAGRASMLSMGATVVYTANVVLILWWPFHEAYGYPYWEDATEIIYLTIALAALYKLLVLLRPTPRHPGERPDPTTEPDSYFR